MLLCVTLCVAKLLNATVRYIYVCLLFALPHMHSNFSIEFSFNFFSIAFGSIHTSRQFSLVNPQFSSPTVVYFLSTSPSFSGPCLPFPRISFPRFLHNFSLALYLSLTLHLQSFVICMHLRLAVSHPSLYFQSPPWLINTFFISFGFQLNSVLVSFSSSIPSSSVILFSIPSLISFL